MKEVCRAWFKGGQTSFQGKCFHHLSNTSKAGEETCVGTQWLTQGIHFLLVIQMHTDVDQRSRGEAENKRRLLESGELTL